MESDLQIPYADAATRGLKTLCLMKGKDRNYIVLPLWTDCHFEMSYILLTPSMMASPSAKTTASVDRDITRCVVQALMDIIILPEGKAIKHKPKVPTFAIRIFNSNRGGWRDLRQTDKYRGESYHFFDDVTKADNDFGLTLFSDAMAVSMLESIILLPNDTQALLIHCFFSESRGPAVGIALDEIFGYNHPELWHQFPRPNMWVYEKLIENAYAMGLMSGHE